MGFCHLALTLCALTGAGAHSGSSETVLLDFQADWCGPCKSMHPAVERLKAVGYPVRQVNIDREPQLAAQYGVSNIPCFVAVIDGQERGRQVGAMSYEQLEQMASSAGLHPAMPGKIGVGDIAQTKPQGGLLRRIRPNGSRRAEAGAGGLARGGRNDKGGAAPLWNPQEGPNGAGPAGADIAGGLTPPVVSAPGPDAPSSDAPLADTGATPPGAMPASATAASVPSASAPPADPATASPAAASGEKTWGPEVASRPAGTQDEVALERRLLSASVRLRVADSSGYDYGSGTIIDFRPDSVGQGGEALVLTCGHIFRDSAGKGQVTIDLFDGGPSKSMSGQIVRYDLTRDVGLVSFRSDRSVTPALLAPLDRPAKQGDAVLSIGCDHGQEPSILRSRVLAVNSFVGPPNLQVTGQPAVGRSGGGLFDDKGRLIGIGNCADPRDHAGLFADVVSARGVLDDAGLSDIHRKAAEAVVAANDGRSSVPKMPEKMPDTGRSDAPASAATATPTTTATGADAKPGTEVICIIRSGNGAETHNETFVIANASPDLLSRLQMEQKNTQVPYPTSLAVPNNGQPRPAPAPTALQRQPVPVDPYPATAPPVSTWQPSWR